MARRTSPSQVRSLIRQAETKRRQAIQKLNSDIRRYDADRKLAMDAYNREVRSYNARVRANQTRLRSYLQRLSGQTVTTQYETIHRSTLALSDAYTLLDNSYADPFLTDLAERDTANSIAVVNVLLDDEAGPPAAQADLRETAMGTALVSISPDLRDRWHGAIYSLSPTNPDAARHFCSSSREIITGILNIVAPDHEVLAAFPYDLHDGKPTRRAKIHYCLAHTGRDNDALESFSDFNIKDLSALFNDLNAGAHGRSGKFSLPQLHAIKVRVEDAIGFVCEVAGISTGVGRVG